MAGPHEMHTDGNAIPPLDDELEDVLATLRGIHPALDLIADGYRLLLLDRHTVDASQTLVAALGGWEQRSVVALAGLAIQRLATPDTNPCLRVLPFDRQKIAQINGETTAFVLTSPTLAQFAADTSAAIDGA